MYRGSMSICSVIVVVCILCVGCGRSGREPVFEMDQDGLDTASVQAEEKIQTDRETLRALLEEVLVSAGSDPVIEVTCSCTGETRVQQVTAESDADVPADDGKLDINTADAADLQELNGIGEVRAQAIISYRESYGAFQSIEEIKQVDGIKDGVFDKIKDEISVG